MLKLEKEEYNMSATILMAVSTFNGRNYPGMERGDSFQGVGNDGKDITIDDCKSQGESVVRYFLKLMPSDDEVDIVMLCSRKTLEKDEKNGIDNKGNIYSAVSYLIERIDRSPEKGKHKINYKVIKLYKNELPVEHRLQEMDDIDPSIPLMPATLRLRKKKYIFLKMNLELFQRRQSSFDIRSCKKKDHLDYILIRMVV